jgi:hypothetical protein
MQNTTIDLLKAALKADPSVTPVERGRIVAFLRNGSAKTQPSAMPSRPSGIIRPAQAARRLDRSVRSVHLLCSQGLLEKVKFPGRKRCAGISSASLEALLANTYAQTVNGAH